MSGVLGRMFRTLSISCLKPPGPGAGKREEVVCDPHMDPTLFPVFLIFLPVPLKSPEEGSLTLDRFRERYNRGQ